MSERSAGIFLTCRQEWWSLCLIENMAEISSPDVQAPVRIDAWLWAVRIFKTRSLASDEVKAGHVRINDEHVKPSQKVRVGDLVRVRYPGWERVFAVKKLLSKRVGAPVAVTCYEDLSEPKPAYLSQPQARRDRGAGRPTKADRREINRLRGYEKE